MGILPTPQQIAQNAFNSTVSLESETINGERIPLGSGFFVRENLIATNLHVVHGVLGNCYAKLVNQTNEYIIEGYTHIDVEHDLIILKVTGINVPLLQWGNSDGAQVGDRVYVVSNPRGLCGTFSDGIISGIRPQLYGKVIQMTAPISSGSSGGPVINVSGEVIGVSFSFFREGQNLNFAIPSNYLNQLLTKPALLKFLYLTKIEGVKWISNPPPFWSETATYTFHMQNKHRWCVRNVHCLVLFYDELKRQIGCDIVKVSDVIFPGTTKEVTRHSIFDVPYLQHLEFNNWDLADKIAFLTSEVIIAGQEPGDYNYVDPIAKRPEGFYEVRIIDYEVLHNND